MVRTIHVRVRPIIPSGAACSRSVPVRGQKRPMSIVVKKSDVSTGGGLLGTRFLGHRKLG